MFVLDDIFLHKKSVLRSAVYQKYLRQYFLLDLLQWNRFEALYLALFRRCADFNTRDMWQVRF